MSDKQRSEWKGGGAAVVGVGLLLVLPVLYVLSVGPVAGLHARGYISPQVTTALEIFYAPLGLARHMTGAGAALDWWIQLWGPAEEQHATRGR